VGIDEENWSGDGIQDLIRRLLEDLDFLGFQVKEIEAAKRKYTDAFGAPTKFDEWANGLSWLIWENKTTVFSLAYVRKRGDAYPLTLPVGAVSSIEYVDRIMRGQLDRRKKNR